MFDVGTLLNISFPPCIACFSSFRDVVVYSREIMDTFSDITKTVV